MSFRTVDVAGFDAVAPRDQAVPVLGWLPIADLVIDDRYQRPLERSGIANVRRIAADFCWSRFSPVLVAPIEGGKYAIIDGQHRTHAAAICGYLTVPAMSVLMPRAEQARAFAAVNGSVTRVSALQIFKAALAAGDPLALRCDDAVTAAGCQLMTYHPSSSQRKAGQIFCVGLIQKMILAGHGASVTAALSGLRAYDLAGNAALYADYILSPWLRAVATDPAFQRASLVQFLRAYDPYKVLNRLRLALAEQDATPNAENSRLAFVVLLRDFIGQVSP